MKQRPNPNCLNSIITMESFISFMRATPITPPAARERYG